MLNLSWLLVRADVPIWNRKDCFGAIIVRLIG